MFALISILIGSFKPFILISYLIIIHEVGHLLASLMLKVKIDKIYIYPFGGISKTDAKLNILLKYELIILIMGPIFQMVGFLLLVPFLNNIKLIELFSIYNYSILIFNLLPIYPLDGGKIINVLLAYKKPYLKSMNITIGISIIITAILLVLSIIVKANLNILLMICFLIYKIEETIKNKYFNFNKFLLERYMYKFNFKKYNIINDEKKFKRDYKHIIKRNNKYYTEKDYLHNKFH